MYSSDLYSQSDIASILPPYEIESNDIIVAGEEVVYNSSKQERHIFDTITKDYTVLGEEGQQSESDGALSGRIDLKVSVLRKVSTDAAMSAASPWFPKKVVIVTKKRRIESMAWAHSSGQ
ncbi:unnamed protein product [Heligmosomoides polygyrus]|uniref:TFIIIC_sub6 domain-containing protein n=1 Tax=Heligmosomoides polygyrus TaxID=6339 RepID=A0A183FUC5_HELPZ|nr:unnamed protein product [Heligmosomoides polygyrus]